MWVVCKVHLKTIMYHIAVVAVGVLGKVGQCAPHKLWCHWLSNQASLTCVRTSATVMPLTVETKQALPVSGPVLLELFDVGYVLLSWFAHWHYVLLGERPLSNQAQWQVGIWSCADGWWQSTANGFPVGRLMVRSSCAAIWLKNLPMYLPVPRHGSNPRIRSQGVPCCQYIDDHHLGPRWLDQADTQIPRPVNFKLVAAANHVAVCILTSLGYFLNFAKSVFVPVQH